jgi:hypothetical protein
MKTIALAASLFLIGAAAHAGTYHVDDVTIRIQDGCRSSACVAVSAPGYGSDEGRNDRGRHSAKLRTVKKDPSRFASAKEDAAAPVPTETVTAKLAERAPQTTPSDAAPAAAK